MKPRQIFTPFRALILFLIIAVCLGTTAYALDWNGSSSAGSGGGTASSGYGVAIDGSALVGFRFSLVSEDGSSQYGNSVDVYTQESYVGTNKFATKKSKAYWVKNYSTVSNLSTTTSTTNVYAQSSLGFASNLPVISSLTDIENLATNLKAWQTKEQNVNIILEKIGDSFVTKVDSMSNEKIIIEPILRVGLANSVQYALTMTELALYGGGYEYNGNWDAGTASYENSNSGSFGYIIQYTNRYFPNYMYTPTATCGWNAASELTTPASFRTIITSGYGANVLSKSDIVGAETYTITYDGNGGTWEGKTTWSETVTYGTSYTTWDNFFTRPGYTFTGWVDQNGTNWTGDIGKPWTWSYNYDVTLYAQWKENTLTVNYYSNYATEAFSETLNAVDEDANVLVRTASFTYTQAMTYGLHNYSASVMARILAEPDTQRQGIHLLGVTPKFFLDTTKKPPAGGFYYLATSIEM